MTPLAAEALRIAISEIGKHEEPHGSNWGPDIKKYLNSVGLVKPNAWCASFVYWCYDEAAKNLKVVNPLYKTGSVLRQWEKNRLLHAVAIPEIGDLVIQDHGKGLGHMFFVKQLYTLPVVAGSTMDTVEGNGNTDGSRDGEAVVTNNRLFPVRLLAGYLRF